MAPVPATPTLLCRYVAYLSQRLKYASLRQYLGVIAHLHKQHSLPNPLADNYFLSLTLRGVRRVKGDAVVRKEPITPLLMFKVLLSLNTNNPRHAAVWAAALLMFFGLLRRSNVLPPSLRGFDQLRHLRRRDLELTPTGVKVTIRWSKTDQFRSRRRVIPLPRIKDHPLCPTQAIFNALRLTPAAPPEGPAFLVGLGPLAPPLTPTVFGSFISKGLSQAGLDPKNFGSHSFRRGGAAFLWSSAGVDESRIKMLGDWASAAYRIYTIADQAALGQATGAMAAVLPPPSSLSERP